MPRIVVVGGYPAIFLAQTVAAAAAKFAIVTEAPNPRSVCPIVCGESLKDLGIWPAGHVPAQPWYRRQRNGKPTRY